MIIDQLRALFEDQYAPYFTYDEFSCKCEHCSGLRLADSDDGTWFKTPEFTAFMMKLTELRVDLGFPMPVNSGYRCEDYNDSIYVALGKTPGTHLTGPHTKGAADIQIYHERMYALVDLATTRKFGVGVKQHGLLEGRFIHIDNQGPRLWGYGS